MTATATITREHHARLERHVDRLAAAAALVGSGQEDQLRDRLDEASSFLTDLLLPHMEAAERVLFPELERLMQNRHSMTPMRREHEQIRGLIRDLEARHETLRVRTLSTGEAVALRRALYRLHGLLMAHLAEEQLYANLVEHGLTPDEEAALADALQHAGTAAF